MLGGQLVEHLQHQHHLLVLGQEKVHLGDVQVLLHRRLDEGQTKVSGHLLNLKAVDGSLVEQVHLGHDEHHGDVAALLLHLPLPPPHLLERLPVHAGEGKDAGLGAPETFRSSFS